MFYENSNNDDNSNNNEILKLRKFKDRVYECSKKYDEVNTSLYNLVSTINEYFTQLNELYYNKINDDKNYLEDLYKHLI